MSPKENHEGLSPSSLGLYQSCGRKYFHKKIAKTPIDQDQSEDQEALLVGKAFHLALEVTKHDLNGFTLEALSKIIIDFDLTIDYHLPLIFAMLGKYKAMHTKSKMKVIACEVEYGDSQFYGIVDVILEDPLGYFWIGDMKTAGNYNPMLAPALLSHVQLNLYAYHAGPILKSLGLEPNRFMGCRYRLVTKSKLTRKADEPNVNYIARMGKAIRAIDFVLPALRMGTDRIMAIHKTAKKFIDTHKDAADYVPNYGNCMSYFRPCEFWSKCHDQTITSPAGIETIEAD